MVKSLLPCLFNLEVLLDSNYKGGAPKNKTAGDNTVQRKGLDPKIIEALKCKFEYLDNLISIFFYLRLCSNFL